MSARSLARVASRARTSRRSRHDPLIFVTASVRRDPGRARTRRRARYAFFMARLFVVVVIVGFVACERVEAPASVASAQPPTAARAVRVASPLENLVAEAWDRGEGEHFLRLDFSFRNTDTSPHGVSASTLRGQSGGVFLTANEAGSAFAEGPIPAGTSRAGRVYFYNMQRIFPRPTTITVTYQDGTYGPFSREVPVTVIPTTGLTLTWNDASATLTRQMVVRPSPMHSSETWVFSATVTVTNTTRERRKLVSSFRLDGESEDVGSLVVGIRDPRDADHVLAPGESVVVPLTFGFRGTDPRPSAVTILYAPVAYARPDERHTFRIAP